MPDPYTIEEEIYEPIVAKAEECRALLEEIRDILLGAGGGAPAAAKLINEFMGSEDLDENGQVYGKDFMIDPEDEDIPPMLKQIHSNPDFVEPETKMSWADYLASLEE